jgi:hypothetical protein
VKRTTSIGRGAVVCAAAAIFAFALASTARAGGNVAACVEGVGTVSGTPARTFCGPAKASVTLNGKRVSFTGGSCATSIGLFSVNVGTVVLGNVKSPPEYFGLTANAKTGTQTRQTIAAVHAGAKRAVIGTVTLKPGLRGGTFAGKAFGSNASIAGSFTC